MDRRYVFLFSLFFGIIGSIIPVMGYVKEVSVGSPVGYWKTIDDVTGRPQSIVKIWRSQDNKLIGKVVKLFTQKNVDPDKIVCTACLGKKHNQPVVGMIILTGLTVIAHHWGNGKILDPANGQAYRCALHTFEHGKKLNVRGYIGLPLLGRSQTWERVDLMSG